MKLPTTLGACADLLYRLRTKRLAAEAKIDAMKRDEQALKAHLLDTLKADDAVGIIGKVAKVTVNSESVGKVDDWDQFYAFITATGAFELLQRRVSDAALRERWAVEETVPGVSPFTIKKVSVTKR